LFGTGIGWEVMAGLVDGIDGVAILMGAGAGWDVAADLFVGIDGVAILIGAGVGWDVAAGLDGAGIGLAVATAGFVEPPAPGEAAPHFLAACMAGVQASSRIALSSPA
jgi:hypothetical protein